jgi:hypothetical protein
VNLLRFALGLMFTGLSAQADMMSIINVTSEAEQIAGVA